MLNNSQLNVKVTKLGAAALLAAWACPGQLQKSKMMIRQSALRGDNSCKICLIGPD